MTIHYLLKKEEVKLTKKIKINFFRFRSQIVAAENPQSHLITNMKKKKKKKKKKELSETGYAIPLYP